MLENTIRNIQICFLFQQYKTIKDIALEFGISQSTTREILIRRFGERTYLQIRKAKIRQTAKRYNFAKYLDNRKIYATNAIKLKKKISRKRSNECLHT